MKKFHEEYRKQFGKLIRYTVEGNRVCLTFAKGTGRLEILTDRIINVFSGFMDEEHHSKAIEGDKAEPTDFTCEMVEKAGTQTVIVKTAYLTVKVSSDFRVDFYRYDGTALSREYRGKLVEVPRMSEADIALLAQEGQTVNRADTDQPIRVARRVDPDECLMGLGDRPGFMDKRGYEYVMWNRDTIDGDEEQQASLYKSIPFILAKKANGAVYGLFFDNSFRSVFNMAKDSPEYLWYGADGGNLDYYFLGGETLADLVREYTALTGRTPLPQRWTLGYQQSRWGYVDEKDVRYITDTMRASGVPCDAIHLDIDYMEAYKIFTWNRDRYPDAPGTLRDLKQKGFKTVTIIDPAIKIEKGYSVYEEGLQNGFFAMNPDGLPYINSVWAGKSLFPDFGSEKVRAWWGKHLRDHLSVGVDGIWNDMNEPASAEGEIPDDVIFHDGARPATHAEMHNVYGHFMSRATYESLKEATGKRPFVITRACYAGTQKYATVWTGDNRSLWQQLRTMIPQLCTLGLCGVSFAGTDIGGFLMDTTPELLTRWVEAACFSPLFRNHCNKGARYQEPWRFGEPTLSIYRSYVKLRYAFLPYLYDLFFQGEQTGLPVMRPLALSYENDPKALRCNSQFLVGENLLVAPVLEPGVEERLVYLPQGEWVDIRTGERIRGGASIVAQAPLDVCPMYAKAGSIFPNYEAMDYVGEKPLDTLILKVYRGNGTYRHYEDNGEDFRYRQGEYNEYQFTIREDGTLTGECLHSGYATKYRQFRIEFEGRHYLLPTSESFKLMLS